MGSWPGADADRWWLTLPPRRREQIHKMMDRAAREERLPEQQLVLDVPAGTLGVAGT